MTEKSSGDYLMEALRSEDGSFTVSLLVACVLLAASAVLSATLKEERGNQAASLSDLSAAGAGCFFPEAVVNSLSFA